MCLDKNAGNSRLKAVYDIHESIQQLGFDLSILPRDLNFEPLIPVLIYMQLVLISQQRARISPQKLFQVKSYRHHTVSK